MFLATVIYSKPVRFYSKISIDVWNLCDISIGFFPVPCTNEVSSFIIILKLSLFLWTFFPLVYKNIALYSVVSIRARRGPLLSACCSAREVTTRSPVAFLLYVCTILVARLIYVYYIIRIIETILYSSSSPTIFLYRLRSAEAYRREERAGGESKNVHTAAHMCIMRVVYTWTLYLFTNKCNTINNWRCNNFVHGLLYCG